VTTRWRAGPAGLTVNSFTSLSLEPPLILWCLNRASGCRAAFTTAGYFAVNVLAADQYETALGFAGPGDRFAGRACRTGAHGLPLLERTVGTLICRRDRIVPAGDHLVVIGEVLDHSARPGAPLLFVDGAYHAGPATGARGSPPGLP
jgi:flavin reductase (DIM6/NTAB) family NADH-FMN oxidoreductase RutF